MDSLEFERLIAVLGELTGVQRQTVAAMLSGDGDLAEVTAMIEARFAAQAVCPQCQSGNIGSWGRSCGLKRYRCLARRSHLLIKKAIYAILFQNREALKMCSIVPGLPCTALPQLRPGAPHAGTRFDRAARICNNPL